MVKNLSSSAGNSSSNPGWGSNIPHATGQLSPHSTTTEPAHRNKDPVQPKIKQTKENKTQGKKENLISRVPVLLNRCPELHSHKPYKETEKYSTFRGKKKNSTKYVPETDLTANVWDQDFKAMVFKVIKELQEEWRKSRKQSVGKIETAIQR